MRCGVADPFTDRSGEHVGLETRIVSRGIANRWVAAPGCGHLLERRVVHLLIVTPLLATVETGVVTGLPPAAGLAPSRFRVVDVRAAGALAFAEG